MIEVRPKGAISRGYEIVEADTYLGSLEYRGIGFGLNARITIETKTYEAYASWARSAATLITLHGPTFYLEDSSGQVARSEPRASWPRSEHLIIYQDQTYSLHYHYAITFLGFSSANFPFKQGNKLLGSIKAGGFLCWKYTIDVPQEVPLLARVFSVYVADTIRSFLPIRIAYCLK